MQTPWRQTWCRLPRYKAPECRLPRRHTPVMWPVMHAGKPTPPGQKEWQTPVKALPCPKLDLQAVTRKHSSRMCTAYMCFSDHQMSSSERVWTGLQRWPPDVTNRRIPCLMSEGRPCTVRSSVRWVMVTWDPPSKQNNRHLWKHYLPATSLADGKYCAEEIWDQWYWHQWGSVQLFCKSIEATMIDLVWNFQALKGTKTDKCQGYFERGCLRSGF